MQNITEFINNQVLVVRHGGYPKSGYCNSHRLLTDVTALLRRYRRLGQTKDVRKRYRQRFDAGSSFVMTKCTVIFKGREIPVEWNVQSTPVTIEHNLKELVKIFESNPTPIPEYSLCKINEEYPTRRTHYIPTTYGGGFHFDRKDEEPIHLIAIINKPKPKRELHIHTTTGEATTALAERITSFATKQAAFPVFVAAACGDPTSSVGKAQTNTAYEHQIWRLVAAFL